MSEKGLSAAWSCGLPVRCMALKSVLASLQGPQGLDNLLYSADADFSCFADLALTSPVEYYREGQGSLLQCVLTPADPYMPLPNEEIAARVHEQVFISLPSQRRISHAN